MAGSTMIVRGTNEKPAASSNLAQFFESNPAFGGQLFIGYPIINAVDHKHPIDAVFVSPEQGIVLFDLVEGTTLGEYQDRQDDAANKLESRLLTHRDLVRRRSLRIPITTVTYGPALATRGIPNQSDYLVANAESFSHVLAGIEWADADREIYDRTLSAIQSISTIRRARRTRKVESQESRGAKLQRLEESIATLDNLQSKAVIETVSGVQRIRGLAGSGKTIVLALKAAYLHAQHPHWRIAVTFSTRSLKAQFTRLITNFSIDQAGEEPDWNNLRIINAWGAPGGPSREGVYHEFCVENDVEYLDFMSAKAMFGQRDAFSGACASALSAVTEPAPTYDAILVDEAQDFPPEFLRLCYSMLPDPKRLVYAYDELQNLSSSGLPSAAEIFGLDATGKPLVTFDEQSYSTGGMRDIILQKCYRNSRPVLATAHALGFGTNRRPVRGGLGLVQIFDEADLWTDIGYKIVNGSLTPGTGVALTRTEDSSPKFLEEHSPIDDLVQFHIFDTAREQNEWVAEQISHNLTHDELTHDDIVVINPDPLTTRRSVGPIRKLLADRGISSHIAGVDTVADVFFRSDSESVTFTGVYRAKGNEAGMIYVVNAEESYDAAVNLARIRNRLFTAITRSKAWVRVVGVGPSMRRLAAEYQAVRDANFELRFRYPTDKERAHLQVVHRDMTPDEANAVKKQRERLAGLISDLDSGRVLPDDLDEDLVAKLREYFQSRDD
ncbi:ATP-binding domain-containing protein [Micromonospora taraxaci]|uniref:DEAD/DEAH box helicase n=1 Tax=Micromonospora TaxID=1873 RepID=UPI0033FEC2DE